MRGSEAMRNTSHSLLAAAIAIAGCGGNGSNSDGGVHHDGGPDDGGQPAPPALGAQLDRMGRPGVATMLIGTFASEPTRTALRDAYAQASDPATWKSTMLQANLSIEREMETNLAVFDALDVGMSTVAMSGCGNALRYNAGAGPASYLAAADMFADDQIYVDTSKPLCSGYLALEIEYGSFSLTPHTTCGGRTPTHDAIDMMYSMLAAGVSGLDLTSDPAPRIHDGAAVHGDVKDSFPFLGPPH